MVESGARLGGEWGVEPVLEESEAHLVWSLLIMKKSSESTTVKKGLELVTEEENVKV